MYKNNSKQPLNGSIQRKNESFFSFFGAVCITLLSFFAAETMAAGGGGATANVIGASGIEAVLQTVVNLLTGAIAKGMALIAIIGLGFAAWSGRLTGALAIKIIIGICIILGATELISALTGKTIDASNI